VERKQTGSRRECGQKRARADEHLSLSKEQVRTQKPRTEKEAQLGCGVVGGGGGGGGWKEPHKPSKLWIERVRSRSHAGANEQLDRGGFPQDIIG